MKQIESSFNDNQLWVLGVQETPIVNEDRFGIIAKDSTGEVLFICFTIRNGKIRPVSGRLTSKKEKDLYATKNY